MFPEGLARLWEGRAQLSQLPALQEFPVLWGNWTQTQRTTVDSPSATGERCRGGDEAAPWRAAVPETGLQPQVRFQQADVGRECVLGCLTPLSLSFLFGRIQSYHLPFACYCED